MRRPHPTHPQLGGGELATPSPNVGGGLGWGEGATALSPLDRKPPALNQTEAPEQDALLGVQAVLGLVPHHRRAGRRSRSAVTSSPRWAGRQCMKTAPGLAAAIRRSSTWKARSMLWRSEVSASPIETQVSVTTQSAPRTASIGSVTMRTLPRAAPSPACPWAAAASPGRRRAGRSRSAPRPGSTSSPCCCRRPTTRRACPSIGPRCSSKVITSAMSWQGWVRSVRPLMTGTVRAPPARAAALLGGAHHDRVDVARQHARGVGDRLAAAELQSRARAPPPRRRAASRRPRTRRACGSTASRRSSPATCRRAAWTRRTAGAGLQRARARGSCAGVRVSLSRSRKCRGCGCRPHSPACCRTPPVAAHCASLACSLGAGPRLREAGVSSDACSASCPPAASHR